MDYSGDSGYIELINCMQPTDEQRNNTEYKPQLKINSEALTIISERFESPISIFVFIGNMGIGKSKLASLTVATLLKEKYNIALSPFRSGNNVLSVTRGVWMWRRPLKDLNNNKKGSILLLDCEGMNGLDQNTSANLYLFCMIISTAFAVILRPPRVDDKQCDRLYNALLRYEQMETPSVLPNLWLVPLDLPRLKNNDKIISEYEWVEKAFSLDESENALSTTENQTLVNRYAYIRQVLPNIHVANITRLPDVFIEDDLKIDDIFTSLREKTCENYYTSLYGAIDRFLKAGGKRLPGSSSNLLYVRPAELAQLMSDLIDVINTGTTPNPDDLIGKYLLTRFNDEVVKHKQAEFENELLSNAEQYAKKNLKERETELQKETTNSYLKNVRTRSTEKYINEMKNLAETKIYGSKSKLLGLNLFQQNLNKVQENMNQYKEPELLIDEIRSIHNVNDQNDQENRQRVLSETTMRKLEKMVDRILREKRINESINQMELQVELEQCSECHRSAGLTSITHSKQSCSSGRKGNYYRYNNESDTMVCEACRELKRISTTQIVCGKCGAFRRVTNIH